MQEDCPRSPRLPSNKRLRTARAAWVQEDFRAINRELALYSEKLGRTPQVVVLTKTDLPHVASRTAETMAGLRAAMRHGRLICVSSQSGERLRELLVRTRQTLDKMDRAADAAAEQPQPAAHEGAAAHADPHGDPQADERGVELSGGLAE
eukprot:906955-Prymnesium_polylepis.1